MIAAMATSQDHAHFLAIAAAETAVEAERIARALEVPPGERMAIGLALDAGMPWTPALLAEADAEADGQMELARRRIALGLSLSSRAFPLA